MQRLMILIFLTTFLVACSAICCEKYKPWGCHGKGACNFFCCNCDDGCDDPSNEKSNWITWKSSSRKINGTVLYASEAFERIDENRDGVISLAEAKSSLEKLGLNSTELVSNNKWFEEMDSNKNGVVECKEFDSAL